MARYHYSREASEDLYSIGIYIATDDPAAADRLLDRIDERCQLLAENPFSGTSAAEIAEGLRCVTVSSYVIFYFPSPDGVRIARVLHGARDLPDAFREGFEQG